MSDTVVLAAAAGHPQHADSDRRRTGRRLVAGAAAALIVVMLASLAIGPTGISLEALPRALFSGIGDASDPASVRDRLVLFDLRLPRTLIGAFVGAALAVSGAMMQGLFRNPLADPGLVGVSSGAALAAVATIALGDSLLVHWQSLLGRYALPVSAFAGGLATTALLVAVAARRGEIAAGTLLLAGIAFAALAGAGSGLIAYASNDQELRDLTLWSMGSLTGASWEKVAALVPFAAALAIGLPAAVRALDGLLLGEAEAFHLGIDVTRAKYLIVALTALAVGSSVAVAGVIGFVGIVVPHLVRLLAGPAHAVLLPASALIGASLLLLADILARTVVAPAELPIGILMALIGAPVFLHLVLRRGSGS
ncbi:MAG: iron ABC transporter permease [Hyphomicrobiaceae bacterium]|nr:iron ABC transporter permease [Hyphomicrobiaceae bacterium]